MTNFKIYIGLICCVLFFSACSDDYKIGNEEVNSNRVNMSTLEFLKSMDETSETAYLFEKAGMADEINGDVTIIAPNNWAVRRYLRRKNNMALRLDPNATLLNLEDIPVADLEQLKMYIVDGAQWRETIPAEGIELTTHDPNVSLRLTVDETNIDPGTAWDGAGTPGDGYQYSNFMQTQPQMIHVHFKRGANWENTPQERKLLGYDNVECDQVYRMFISDVITNNGVVHVIYSGDYNFTDHYYYHSLFFFGTRDDDTL